MKYFKMKCIGPMLFDAKSIRLACLLSFASLFIQYCSKDFNLVSQKVVHHIFFHLQLSAPSIHQLAWEPQSIPTPAEYDIYFNSALGWIQLGGVDCYKLVNWQIEKLFSSTRSWVPVEKDVGLTPGMEVWTATHHLGTQHIILKNYQ